ncbi:MAG TPA: hypothetical protein VFI97_08295 [Arthrobacter sp.]|nr:hypothetical protein [Arthrobacter sp.]
MTHWEKRHWGRKIAAALILPVAAVLVAGCEPAEPAPQELPVEEQFGEEVDEARTGAADTPPKDFVYDVTYPYAVDYREGIPANLDELVGESIAVSAKISQIVSPRAFILSGSGSGNSTGDGLLVIHHQSLPGLSAGGTVGVRGVVHDSFDPSNIEQDLRWDGGSQSFKDSAGEPYINATNIDTSTAGSEAGADVEDIVQVEPEGTAEKP